jgi:hypothetical protein
MLQPIPARLVPSGNSWTAFTQSLSHPGNERPEQTAPRDYNGSSMQVSSDPAYDSNGANDHCLLGVFPRTGFSRLFISCINAAKRRNKPALFMASCRAGPGGMLRAISIARSAFASQWVFGSVFFPLKKRPYIVTRSAIDPGKVVWKGQRLTKGSASLPEFVGQFADALDGDGDLVDRFFH